MPLVSTEASSAPAQSDARRAAPHQAWVLVRRWWFVLVIVVAALELVLHLWQTRDVIHDEDWAAVKTAVQEQTSKEDLVVTAPSWIDPLSRMHLGDELVTLERAARADESRFPHATEVGYGGARHPSLSNWTVESEVEVGPFVVRRLTNPEHRPVIDDLVAKALPASMDVSRASGGKQNPCTWRKSKAATGALGFGPAGPAQRFQCDRNDWVAQTVVADMDYAPRRCIYAPPPSQGALQLRFRNVRFGKRLEGHHALYVEAERNREGAPVHIAFSYDGKPIGKATHEDGQGWTGFGFDTPTLVGTSGELVAEITSGGKRRMYCFEATTR